jgi:hypothetical protein
LAAPRGLSQPPTSFIGFWRLGIHHVPFVTWQLLKMLALAMQFSRFPARVPYPPVRTCRPVRDQGRSLVARCSRRLSEETLPQSSTVCAAGLFPIPPFPTPCGAVLSEPEDGPAE